MKYMTLEEFYEKQNKITLLDIPILKKQMLDRDLTLEWRFQQLEKKVGILVGG